MAAGVENAVAIRVHTDSAETVVVVIWDGEDLDHVLFFGQWNNL